MTKSHFRSVLLHLTRFRCVYVALAAVLISVGYSLAGELIPLSSVRWIFGAYIVLFALLLPSRAAVALAFVVFGLIGVMSKANEVKIAATRIPLTFTDLRFFLGGPEGVLDSIGIPLAAAYALPVGGLIVSVGLIGLVIEPAWKARGRLGWNSVRRAVAAISSVVIFLVAVQLFLGTFEARVLAHVNKDDIGWKPEDIVGLSRELGIVGFLTYSGFIEKMDTGDFFRSGIGGPPLSPVEVREAVASSVTPRPVADASLPNIVLVLAESTFDPTDFFELTKPVESDLFRPGKYTRALGRLRVNIIGGGTWVSEYESISGIDSRLFGYTGFYSHLTLAPLIKRTFLHYLLDRGYTTYAYYSTDGNFYNARSASEKYGYQSFFDGKDLHLRSWQESDVAISQAMIDRGPVDDREPFFKYVNFIENHSLPNCEHFQTREQFTTQFARDSDFDLNCRLNEYVRRLHSSEEGFRRIIAYLENVQKRTGRPFVALIFGDHQPHAFTEGASTRGTYAPLRRDKELRDTFFHLVSSVDGIVHCCNTPPPPLSLLPSLMSAYVAKNVDEMYVGLNFYQYLHCGSDFMANHISWGLYGTDQPGIPVVERPTKFCSDYDRLLTGYRHAGVF